MSRTEQEEKLEVIFSGLESAFKKIDKIKDDVKRQAALKDITSKLRDAKALIKEFEREARTDGMPARELADRKRTLVNELNSYIALKKNYSGTEDARGELLAGVAAQGEGGGAGVEKTNPYDGLTMQELVKEGRKGMQETEATLNRTEKLVEDTLQIGAQ
ncbi:putative plant SNARE 13, partial [Monoraphidium neglectum]